jgi:hypothetical protein
MSPKTPTLFQDVIPPLEAPVTVVARTFHTVDHTTQHVEGEEYSVDDSVLLSTLVGCHFVGLVGWTPPPVATGATAGSPGTWTPAGSTVPGDLAAMSGVTASPTTAWTTGQHMVLGDGSHCAWNATAWVAGDAAAAAVHRRH